MSPQDEPVGNVGDEAAKLLGALAGWAGDHLKEVNDALKKYVDPKKFSSLKVGDFKQVAAPK